RTSSLSTKSGPRSAGWHPPHTRLSVEEATRPRPCVRSSPSVPLEAHDGARVRSTPGSVEVPACDPRRAALPTELDDLVLVGATVQRQIEFEWKDSLLP